MLARAYVPATVSIAIERSYDRTNREISASINFTALEPLSGEFRYNVILVEDGIVWQQAGSQGGPNYIHDWTVRDMMNGYLGEEIISGNWAQGQIIQKTITHTIAVPPGPGPDIVPDSCRVVVMVYRAGLPLNSNAEIQQAIQVDLTVPDYDVSLTSPGADFLGDSTQTAQNTVVVKNSGLADDTYYISLNFEGPAGWTRSFTTINGTFPPGAIDSIAVNSGDSTIITVEVSANLIDGYGITTVDARSKNHPAATGSLDLRFTTFGQDILVVDGENASYEAYLVSALDSLGANYGVSSAGMLQSVSTSKLLEFKMLMWMSSLSQPALTPEDMSVISGYLDAGGRIFLNGIDIAYQFADPASPYHTPASLDFLTDYLHTSYLNRVLAFYVVQGKNGDPVSGNINQMWLTGGSGASTIGFSNGKYANQIDVADSGTVPIFSVLSTLHAGIRAIHNGASSTGRVVFTTFGFETIAENDNRIKLTAGVIDWLGEGIITGIDDSAPETAIYTFELRQNYPNPFNPATHIFYQLPEGSGTGQVSLIIYNQLGQKVKTLINEPQNAGRYQAVWNGKDDAGRDVSSGIYFYQLRYGDYRATKKMILMQ